MSGDRSRHADVVVVGGGVIGLACAIFLRRRGLSVIVVERGLPCGETSITTGGGMRLQWPQPFNIQMSKLSIPAWKELEAESGIDLERRSVGWLYLGRTPERAAELAELVSMQRALGVPNEYLEPEAIARRWPVLPAERFRGGAYCSVDFRANQFRAAQVLYELAVAAGASVITGTEVTAVTLDGERVTGVEMRATRLSCDTVVNAAGPWAGSIAALAGVALPLVSRLSHLIEVDFAHPLPEGIPWLFDLDAGCHARIDPPSPTLVGGQLRASPEIDPAVPFDRRHDPEWAKVSLAQVEEAFGLTRASQARIVAGWTGIFSGPPDALPIIERTLPGLVTATGFSGSGLQHAPAAGILVSELIADGAATSLDLSPVSSSRLEDAEIEWTAVF